ncbi:MAG: RDD family protein [Candidatus Bathyarchaeia archaeon]
MTGQQVDVANNWLQRLVAAIIDSIPFAIVGYIISWVLFFGAGFGSPMWRFVIGWGWLIWLFIWPLFYGIPLLIYCYVMENGANAATLGKKVMGLQVQAVGGGKAESGKVLKRNLSKILWIIFLIDILLGVATKGPDPRQRYFDRLAGTTVVTTKEVLGAAAPPPPPPPPPA